MRPAASLYHASDDCLYFVDSEVCICGFGITNLLCITSSNEAPVLHVLFFQYFSVVKRE